MDQLRDRAALRARQRRRAHHRGRCCGDAVSSPITLGILVGYVVGKPLGIVAASWLATRPRCTGRARRSAARCSGRRGRRRRRLHRLAADRRASPSRGSELDEAKLGVLASVVVAPVLALAVIRGDPSLPAHPCARVSSAAPPRTSSTSPTTSIPSATTSAGPTTRPVTLVEYGDFECPYCGQAEPAIRELLRNAGDDLRYVWRHLPLSDVHPSAQLAAEASEAAAAQGAFWEMHDAAAGPPGRARPRRARSATPRSSGSTPSGSSSEVRRREYAAPRHRGRRQRRRERRLGHADLLHQRPPPLRRLRHRDADQIDQAGEEAGRSRSRGDDRTLSPAIKSAAAGTTMNSGSGECE